MATPFAICLSNLQFNTYIALGASAMGEKNEKGLSLEILTIFELI